jgi:hypothetical protein
MNVFGTTYLTIIFVLYFVFFKKYTYSVLRSRICKEPHHFDRDGGAATEQKPHKKKPVPQKKDAVLQHCIKKNFVTVRYLRYNIYFTSSKRRVV